MKIITSRSISRQSFDSLFRDALKYLASDLNRWHSFKKSIRHATHFSHGVFELMPCASDKYYTYKYVNAHPGNPKAGKLSIVALGMLADVATGYPQLVCDMTLLTAVRTAAMSALAARNFSVRDARVLGLIGTGAQSEFQVHAMRSVRTITSVRYFDRDPAAMKKFARNMRGSGLTLVACRSGDQVVRGCDIVTTCICEKKKVRLFSYKSVQNNKRLFVNAIGGDCPGKTELDPALMRNSRVIVEYYEQTKLEGEIQNIKGKVSCDEMWEVVQGKKKGRRASDGIIVFDSVGFALADHSMLRMMHERGVGSDVALVPAPKNAKNLIGEFKNR
ncbi:MAG: ornithine cyclodeaminase [Candidatus Pacebacteria bacterium]|nr:ornithine cyclodeaminase [Candidatus Paceibacterota bacterium]